MRSLYMSKNTQVIERKLNTKTAQKYLPEDVRAFIATIENTKQAQIIIKYALNYTKKNGSITIADITNAINRVNTIYIPQNDYKYYLYEILFRELDTSDDITLSRYANISDTCYIFEYARLISIGLPDEKINMLMQEKKAVGQKNATRNFPCDPETHLYSLYDTFFYFSGENSNNKSLKEDCSSLLERYLDSNLVKQMLDQGLHFAKTSPNFYKKENLVCLCENSSINDFSLTNDGDIILIDKNANFYKDAALAYINKGKEEHPESYRKYLYTKAQQLESSDFFDCLKSIYKNIPFLKSNTCDITLADIPLTQIELFVSSDSVTLDIAHSRDTITVINTTMTEVPNNLHERQLTDITYKLPSNISSYKFIAYTKEDIYISYQNKPLRPVYLQDLIKVSHLDLEIKKIIMDWLDYACSIHPFYKDIKALYEFCYDNKSLCFPISLKEGFLYHSWNEFFHAKYKCASLFNINYNKIPPMAAYALFKVYHYIPSTDYSIFLDAAIKNKKNIILTNRNNYHNHYNKGKAIAYLENYYGNKLNIDNPDSDLRYYGYSIIHDWINLCIQSKQKISLRKTSIAKINEAHDDINISLFVKHQRKIKNKQIIKKDSKFTKLRELLPQEFEWITNSKRLSFESEIQHHCVWSYENMVKADVCAIYSYVYPETKNRHTIEFRIKNGKYKIEQIQKKYDRGCDNGVRELIQSYLDKQ